MLFLSIIFQFEHTISAVSRVSTPHLFDNLHRIACKSSYNNKICN